MLHKILIQYRFLFLLAFLLCLPCPTKREFKKAFNIPVSEVSKQDSKDNYCVSIAEYTVDEAGKTQPYQQNIHPFIGEDEIATIESSIYFETVDSFETQNLLSPKVPLFILHEQYRI